MIETAILTKIIQSYFAETCLEKKHYKDFLQSNATPRAGYFQAQLKDVQQCEEKKHYPEGGNFQDKTNAPYKVNVYYLV